MENDGSQLLYNGVELSIEGYALPFHNMDKVELTEIWGCIAHFFVRHPTDKKSFSSINSEDAMTCFLHYSFTGKKKDVFHITRSQPCSQRGY
jgi:hypothetical protein